MGHLEGLAYRLVVYHGFVAIGVVHAGGLEARRIDNVDIPVSVW